MATMLSAKRLDRPALIVVRSWGAGRCHRMYINEYEIANENEEYITPLYHSIDIIMRMKWSEFCYGFLLLFSCSDLRPMLMLAKPRIKFICLLRRYEIHFVARNHHYYDHYFHWRISFIPLWSLLPYIIIREYTRISLWLCLSPC